MKPRVKAGAAILLLLAAACSNRTAGAPPPQSPTPEVAIQQQAAPAGCPSGTAASDADQLTRALIATRPGTVIVLAANTYPGHFVATTSGTPDAPITLCGSRDSILDGGSIKTGYTLYLNGASWWRLVGFSVQGGQKGVMLDRSNHVLISGLYVHDVGDEGIHLRSFSSDNTIDGVTVHTTGLVNAKFGEGIYVGTANSNWCRYSGCKPDMSDRNVIENSTISGTSAENIDIKEGTTGGQIIGNALSGDGISPAGASSWVNVKGNDWTIVGNVGLHSPKDGFQVHRVYSGWGYRNSFHGNRAVVDGPGFGIYVQFSSLATVVGCDNVAVGAARGLSNARCTP